MRILIITYYYSPWPNPRAIRWTALSNAFASQGNKIDVLCKSKNGEISISDNNAINLYYTDKSKKRGERFYNDENYCKNFFVYKYKATILKLLKIIHSLTWKKIYWPDHACLWYFRALKVGKKLLNNNQYDLIISVSLPYTSHLVALKLRALQPNTRWIVDIGDPFYFLSSTPTNNHSIYSKLNYYSEKNVLYSADSISVTNSAVAVIYRDLFPECENKIHVIPPVLGASNKVCNPFFKNKEKIILVYIGTLYRNIRSPVPLLKILEYLDKTELHNKLELHIVGTIKDCEKYFSGNKNINRNIFLHGVVDNKVVNQFLYDDVFLINIGNKTSYQLPSKIVEYISSGNPIINIYSNEHDSSVEFLKRYPLKLNVDEKLIEFDIGKIKNYIKEHNGDRVDEDEINKVLEPFKPETVSEKYLSLCL